MSDGKDEKDETKWDFQVEGVKTDEENVERKKRKERLAKRLGQAEEKRDAEKDLLQAKKPKKMALNSAPSSSRKSRAKLAEEMRQADIPDFNDLMASPIKRGIAFAIDAVIFGAIFYGANSFWDKIEYYILQLLRQEEINQPLDPETFKMVVMSAIGVIVYYVVIALPVCFTKQSWGKSFTNLNIQSADEEQDLGFFSVVFREFIAKPISLATVFGSFLLFFNDEKRTLHDLVAGTVVMDDSLSVDPDEIQIGGPKR